MSETTRFRVMDFDCPSCASTVERALSNQKGVKDVELHYSTGRVEIDYDDSVVDPTTFEQTIQNQGYTPHPA
jgi:copper chaperone